MKKLLKKLTQKKIYEVRQELARAHLIIALLSVAVIILLVEGTVTPIAFNAHLSSVGIVLMSFVGLTSLVMSFVLTAIKKK